jgi:hypothetical protein
MFPHALFQEGRQVDHGLWMVELTHSQSTHMRMFWMGWHGTHELRAQWFYLSVRLGYGSVDNH